ncbi:MAG: hypothetical protein JW788_00560 [Candidatus Omnitrophica bacterium]|nr:hypothetical protein [Candidatus Omnitrophota bacterium]
MQNFNFLGVYAFIPMTMLLVVSFFVLFTARKIEQQGLKVFAYVLAVCLWIAAAMVLSGGIYVLTTGRCSMMKKMHYMQGQGGMGGPMMQQRMMNK